MNLSTLKLARKQGCSGQKVSTPLRIKTKASNLNFPVFFNRRGYREHGEEGLTIRFHSWYSLLNPSFPLRGLCGLCGYVFLLLVLITACSFSYDAVSQNDDDPNLVMENTEYVRIVNGNPEIRAKAEKLRRYEAKHIMELDKFSFEQYNAAPEGQKTIPDINTRGKATMAHMETDTNNTLIYGNISIEVVSEDIVLETSELSWQDKERLLSAPGLVHIRRTDGTTIKGMGFSADARSRSWEIKSSVEGTVVEKEEKETE